MSYSPARIDETTKPEIDPPARPESNPATATPIPSWFADGFGHEDNLAAAERYRERLARHAERQRSENEQMEEYRRKLDEKFVLAKQLYDRPGNDNPRDASRAEPRLSEPAAESAATFPQQSSQTRLPMGSSSAEPMLRARRPTVPLAEIEKRRKRYVKEGKDFKQRRPQKRPSSNLGFYAASAAIAIMVGGATGYGFANRSHVLAFTQDGFDRALQLVSAMTAKPATAPTMVLASSGSSTLTKPITSARLAVNDVRGQLNSMIPLMLTATPASADQPVDLEISGLPQSAYLTAGHQKEDGSWVVKAPEIADLKLVIPESLNPKIDLQVAAVEQNSGSLAAPAQLMSVELSDVKITPASAPPEGQPDPVKLKPAATAQDAAASSAIPVSATPSQGAGADLLARADGLMNQGDILSARQYYMQASAAGNPRGTLGVARSYDPKVFAEMKVEGLQPDAAKAAEWYKKAQAQGLTAQQ
jgi:hypothetical protein